MAHAQPLASRAVRPDALRTVAVLFMLAANAAPYALETTPAPSFRLISSLAAPLFVFLSGVMTGHGHGDTDLSARRRHLLRRALLLACTATFVDVFIWGTPPFQSFDVLYLIALGIAVNALLLGSPSMLPPALVVLLVVVAVPARWWAGYRHAMTEPAWDVIRSSGVDVTRAFVDGWFPVFPWLAVAIAGAWVRERDVRPGPAALWSLAALVAVSIIAVLDDAEGVPLRSGYVELFYPPSGAMLILLFAVPLLAELSPMPPGSWWRGALLLPGRHGLFVYILHCILIAIDPAGLFSPGPPLHFAGAVTLLVVVAYLGTAMLERLQASPLHQRIPRILRDLTGT
jgi:uncharacterized membrane protein